ncbi:MAG: hypothetical protein NXH74_09400 [Rhodobacteraceae bacterium]|nr:hypothetical protein [Paracoccaceae bacterium]
MGEEELDDYLELVKHEFFTLRIEWRLYRSLFGTNKETVELLNKASRITARTLERVLFERTLLGLRRLTDPYSGKKGKTKSVSVNGFVHIVPSEDQDLRRLAGIAVQKSSFARNWSAKRIAHADLAYRRGEAKLETASRASVESANGAIANVLKHVAKKYYDTTLVTHPVPPLGDERSFLRVLYLGVLACDEERASEKQLLKERNLKELDRLQTWHERMPDWLKRDDPPIDAD